MTQERQTQELADRRLALATLSVRLEALVIRRGIAAPPPQAQIFRSFAQRTVQAMRHRPAEDETRAPSPEDRNLFLV